MKRMFSTVKSLMMITAIIIGFVIPVDAATKRKTQQHVAKIRPVKAKLAPMLRTPWPVSLIGKPFFDRLRLGNFVTVLDQESSPIEASDDSVSIKTDSKNILGYEWKIASTEYKFDGIDQKCVNGKSTCYLYLEKDDFIIVINVIDDEMREQFGNRIIIKYNFGSNGELLKETSYPGLPGSIGIPEVVLLDRNDSGFPTSKAAAIKKNQMAIMAHATLRTDREREKRLLAEAADAARQRALRAQLAYEEERLRRRQEEAEEDEEDDRRMAARRAQRDTNFAATMASINQVGQAIVARVQQQEAQKRAARNYTPAIPPYVPQPSFQARTYTPPAYIPPASVAAPMPTISTPRVSSGIATSPSTADTNGAGNGSSGRTHHPELVVNQCVQITQTSEGRRLTNACGMVIGVAWCLDGGETNGCNSGRSNIAHLSVELKPRESYFYWGDIDKPLHYAACNRSRGYVVVELAPQNKIRCKQ